MLKKRIIPMLLLLDGRMVKGRQFKDFRDTGLPKTAVRIYSSQDADELMFINIDRNKGAFERMEKLLIEASRECFMPLTAGGGITSEDQVERLFKAGVDKIVITTAAYNDIGFINKMSKKYGSQSIVAGIEYKENDGLAKITVENGKYETDEEIQEYAKKLMQAGAGEIFLNCVTRDGMMNGYDLETLKKVLDCVNIPVIEAGGAGNYKHLADAMQKTNVSAVACASLFHFGDNSPIRARSYMRNAGIPMRKLK